VHRNDNTIISQDSRNPLHAGHVFRGFPIHLRYGLPGCSPPEKSQVFSLPFMANSLLPSTAGLAAARASRSKLSASQHRFPGVGIGQLPSHFSRLLRAASLKDRDRCIVPPRNHASVAGALTRLRNRKFGDSPLEGTGFELPVPRGDRPWFRAPRRPSVRRDLLPRRASPLSHLGTSRANSRACRNFCN